MQSDDARSGAPPAGGDGGPESEGERIEVRLFLEAIRARYGYDLSGYAPASMRRRVLNALAASGLGNLGELQHRLLHEPRLFADVFERLTVRVSELFRDPGFYRAFREQVTPILRTYARLNVWVGGCATGEEAYSVAILLSEEGLYERTQIYATDLSPLAIEQAKQGIYPADQLATVDENHRRAGGQQPLSDFYTAAYDRIAMREPLRRNILFFQHDLVGDHVFAEMNVIFCRNVLIYFGAELRDQVLHKLTQSLCRGGFLCLGTSEALSRAAQSSFTTFAARERIYRQVPST
jgi:chemotaxis protein methyltransferase CheR